MNSRDLFQNWLSVGVKYLLIRYGLIKDNIAIECSNNVFTLDPKVYLFIVSAYFNGYLEDVSCDDMPRGRLWDTIDLVILKDGRGFLRMPGDAIVSLESFDRTVISETWLFDIHFLGFDLNGWLIVDVGAYIGDTPLYYAKRGVFVIAAEPLPK